MCITSSADGMSSNIIEYWTLWALEHGHTDNNACKSDNGIDI